MATDKNTGNIYSVTQLTRQIKNLLEETYPFIWITGEISNFSTPASGHSYFTLKDDSATIQAVMFKHQKRGLNFAPENGLKIFGLCRLSVYEPRGSYQLIFEHMEPEGAGSAQISFEQLKKKLNQLGYFDSDIKKKIPFLSEKVALITSGTGAAVEDILNISQRRFPNCRIDIIQVQVQGELAVPQITKAIEYSDTHICPNVIILARGGGSIEDLAAFNSEEVAHAIFHAKTPIVTGVGHETDYTIADFVADLRAPTPSASAELVFPEKHHLVYTVQDFENRIYKQINTRITSYLDTVYSLVERIKTPDRIMDDYRLKLLDYENRLTLSLSKLCHHYEENLNWLTDSLASFHPQNRIDELKDRIIGHIYMLNHQVKLNQEKAGLVLDNLKNKLEAFNPDSVLQRGYSITRRFQTGELITSSDEVKPGDLLEIILHNGKINTKVE